MSGAVDVISAARAKAGIGPEWELLSFNPCRADGFVDLSPPVWWTDHWLVVFVHEQLHARAEVVMKRSETAA